MWPKEQFWIQNFTKWRALIFHMNKSYYATENSNSHQLLCEGKIWDHPWKVLLCHEKYLRIFPLHNTIPASATHGGQHIVTNSWRWHLGQNLCCMCRMYAGMPVCLWTLRKCWSLWMLVQRTLRMSSRPFAETVWLWRATLKQITPCYLLTTPTTTCSYYPRFWC